MKYFIYTRKSTESAERQVMSLESQFSELKEFAAKEKLEIVASLSEAQTAKEPGRKIFAEILDLKFPTFWFDSTPQGKFMLNIAFGQSKYYVDNLSENIKRGHRQKLRKGIWPGFAPEKPAEFWLGTPTD